MALHGSCCTLLRSSTGEGFSVRSSGRLHRQDRKERELAPGVLDGQPVTCGLGLSEGSSLTCGVARSCFDCNIRTKYHLSAPSALAGPTSTRAPTGRSGLFSAEQDGSMFSGKRQMRRPDFRVYAQPHRSGGGDHLDSQTKTSQGKQDAKSLYADMFWDQTLADPSPPGDANWDPSSINMRIGYSLLMYGGLAFFGSIIADIAGVDVWGGFDLTVDAFLKGVLFAVPPIVLLGLIQKDSVVEACPPARALRDAEDEELLDYYIGMQPWQLAITSIAAAGAEELFFRASIQGALTHAFQISGRGVDATTYGMAALTGIIPSFFPISNAFAAVLSAAITGSMYYILANPRDPKFVIVPVGSGPHRTLAKKRFEDWYEQRMLRKIYSPLMEGLNSLYFGLVWIISGNLLCPIVAHAIFFSISVGEGVTRLECSSPTRLPAHMRQPGYESRSAPISSGAFETTSLCSNDATTAAPLPPVLATSALRPGAEELPSTSTGTSTGISEESSLPGSKVSVSVSCASGEAGEVSGGRPGVFTEESETGARSSLIGGDAMGRDGQEAVGPKAADLHSGGVVAGSTQVMARASDEALD